MIELPCSPVGRVVAAVTLIAEAAAMRIIVAVTGHTDAVGVVKRRSCMAALTRDIRVCTDQRKTRDVMIEPHSRSPTRGNVASYTSIAELPLMHIIVGMAAATFRRQRVVEISGVTGTACEATVTGGKREAGACFMIEVRGIPVKDIMAGATVRAESTFVCVVATMTRATAVVVEIAKVDSAMTSLAAQVFVTTE